MKRIKTVVLILTLLVLLVSCSTPRPENNDTILKVGNSKICYDYYRYVFLNTRDDLCDGDTSLFYSDFLLQAELNDSVLETIVRNCAIEKLAEKYDVELTSDEKKEIKEWLSEQKEELGDDYDTSLESSYMTEYVLWYVKSFNALWGKAYDYITDIENGVIQCSYDDVVTSVKDSFYCIKYVMISKDEDDALKTAQTVASLCGTTEFEELIREYNQDSKMNNQIDDGCYYACGEMIEDVESEVSQMKVGEISDILDTDLGYFIVKKCEISEDYVKDNYSDMEEKYIASVFNKMIDEIASELEIKYTSEYGKLTVYTVE